MDINVEIDFEINKQLYISTLDAILKYILYQRHQIPLSMDILERELNRSLDGNEEKCPCEEELSHLTAKQKVMKRKQEWKNTRHRFKRQRWLTKLSQVFSNYKDILGSLQNLTDGAPEEVAFVLGPSIYTAKEIYKVSFPHTLFVNETYGSQKLSALNKRLLLQSFKSFAAHEELDKLVSSHSNVSKVWILMKKSSPTKDNPNSAIFPRSDYTFPKRAKIINIYFHERIPSYPSLTDQLMDLTPCLRGGKVNATHNPGGRGKLSLFSKFQSMECNQMDSDLNCSSSRKPPLNGKRKFHSLLPSNQVSSPNFMFKTPLNRVKKEGFYSFNQGGCCATPTSTDSIDTQMIETPVVSNFISVSPVKSLSLDLKDFQFSPVKLNDEPSCIWYQLSLFVSGFKDLCL